jgi:DNA primase
MHQSGIQNVVSSSGTSLTKEQIKLVKRYTQNLTILYDGDAAGIKASFRGIDLILEEGMNVKVVLFPDGEDPDSFAKKTSTTQLETFIKSHKQDFITFKASILLKEGESDPLKKSELIREIVHSVSLIPDQITRSVYVQEIAKQFDISETIISNELMRLRKNTIAKQIQEPELKEAPLPLNTESFDSNNITETIQNEKESNFLFEKELIRLLMKYGIREVHIPNAVDNEKNKTSVIELIHEELNKDELTFDFPLFAKIYSQFVEGLSENTLYSSSFFLRQEDQEIVSFVSDIESNEQEISHNWVVKKNIFTRLESDDLYSTVIFSIYNFKYNKVDMHLKELKRKLATETLEDNDLLLLLSEQMAYERVKKVFSEKLGRIILR